MRELINQLKDIKLAIFDLDGVIYRGNSLIPNSDKVINDLKENSQYLSLACRMAAEHGAHVVKTYYCEKGFEEVTGGCTVPVVMAGGKAGDPLGALKQTYKAIQKGAIGVDMGRNIFQAENPIAMIKAVRSIVHEGYRPNKAHRLYKDLLKK